MVQDPPNLDAKVLEKMETVVKACSKATLTIVERHDKQTVPRVNELEEEVKDLKKELKELKTKMERLEGILEALLNLGTLVHDAEI